MHIGLVRAIPVAACATVISICISCYTLYGHLRNYNIPSHQKLICRLLLLVPVYSTLSLLSMTNEPSAIVFGTLRDCYEAYVIYTFFSLLMTYLGGDAVLGEWLELQGHVKHVWWVTRVFPSKRYMSLGPEFLVWVRKGVLQFVFVKPIMSLLALFFSFYGLYHEGRFVFNDSYVYISIVCNLSVTLSLYCLVMFYVATEKLLEPYKPIGKFLAIKAVVFFSYWQTSLFQVLFWFEVLESKQDISVLEGALLCVEMVLAAIGHHLAFPYAPYIKDESGRSPMSSTNLAHGIAKRHAYSDFDNEFAETEESSTLLPRIIDVLDGSQIWKEGKEMFIDADKLVIQEELEDQRVTLA